MVKRGNRFQALIYIGGKQQNIGRFGMAKEAAEAYDQAALQAGHSASMFNFFDESSEKKKKNVTPPPQPPQPQPLPLPLAPVLVAPFKLITPFNVSPLPVYRKTAPKEVSSDSSDGEGTWF